MTEPNPYKSAVTLVAERAGGRALTADETDRLARELWDLLHYLSTACAHDLFDDKAEPRAPCRSTCKWCSRPCKGPNHPLPGEADDRPHPVDQARNIARRLMAEWPSPELAQEITTNPDYFWLCGGEQPPGVWTPPEERP